MSTLFPQQGFTVGDPLDRCYTPDALCDAVVLAEHAAAVRDEAVAWLTGAESVAPPKPKGKRGKGACGV